MHVINLHIDVIHFYIFFLRINHLDPRFIYLSSLNFVLFFFLPRAPWSTLSAAGRRLR